MGRPIYHLAPIVLSQGDPVEVATELALWRIRKSIEASAEMHAMAIRSQYYRIMVDHSNRVEDVRRAFRRKLNERAKIR